MEHYNLLTNTPSLRHCRQQV